MNALAIAVCRSCGRKFFPLPLACRQCGGSDFDSVRAPAGTVEEVTEVTVTRSRIGSVRLDAGPVVVAQVGQSTKPGDRVELVGGSKITASRI